MNIAPSKERCYIVAEIGINHQGDINKALKLVRLSKNAGADAVKFQKRDIGLVYTKEELDAPRESIYGVTNGSLKYGLEFGPAEYQMLYDACRTLDIDFFASPWDENSVQFLADLKVPYLKVASASITDKNLLKAMCKTGIPLLVSTGMADLAIIKRVVHTIKVFGGEIACLYHCTSTYPSETRELNLRGIATLQQEFPNLNIGYSGHEPGVPTSIMAAVLGATSVERHLTTSRADWGSDQAASLEYTGFARVVSGIRQWEEARGDGEIVIYDSERPIIDKLRRVDDIFEA